MAAATALRPRTADRFMERVALFADRVSGYRLGGYAATQGYVRQSASPFDGFGAVVAAGSKPLPIGHALMEAAQFTVEEARERLAAFIEGRFVPDSLHGLIEYLGERFMRLETRIGAGGRIANFLVDVRSSQAVPAAQVDPRLSHAAILGDRLRASLRRQIGKDAPADAFDSWQGMMLVLDDRHGGYGYTASGATGWYGKIHAIASADREENIRIVREARAKGIDLVLPRVQDGPVSNLVAGMPILVRTQAMRAAEVHPGLDHDRLASEFARRVPGRRRASMAEAFSHLGKKARSQPSHVEAPAIVRAPSPSTTPVAAIPAARGAANRARSEARSSNVVFLESFHRKNVRPHREDMEEDTSLGFGGLGGLEGEHDLVIRRDETDDKLYVFDRDLSEEVPISPNSLPAGRYERESSAGAKEGYTEVGQGGGLRHLALDGSQVQLRRKPSPDFDPALELDDPEGPSLPVPGPKYFR